MLIIILSTLGGISYLFLIFYFLYYWSKIPPWRVPSDFQGSTSVAIIIPARNEAHNIETCVRAILAQHYPEPLMEVVVVDDHSEDATAAIVQNIADPRVKLIRLVNFPIRGQAFKKHGIQVGIQQSRGELILCTDADCVMGPDWVRNMVAFHSCGKVQMIAGPVNFHHERNFLERFQSLDFLGMMLLTGAGLYSGVMRMGNGANLAYTRSAFEAVEGFNRIDHLASGDDLFLMHKIAQRYPGQVKFLKSLEATVYTLAMPDWYSFVQQRLRWGTKNAAYQEWQIIAVLGLVFFICWGIVVLGLASLLFCDLFSAFCILLFSKTIADYLLLSRASTYFKRKDLLQIFWPAQILHVFYIAGIGLAANVYKNYTWKGRQVK